MIEQRCLIATTEVLEDLSNAPAAWGWLDLNVSQREGLAAIEAYTHGIGFQGVRMAGRARDLPDGHRLRTGAKIPYAAVWYRGRPDVPFAAMHEMTRRRPRAAYPISEFQAMIGQGWREPSADRVFEVLVEDRSTTPSTWTAWDLADGAAVPANLLVYDKQTELTSIFAGHWPQAETRQATVALVGVGSIGSAAAMALIGYEVRNIVLLDPDRLYPHNVARHQCGAEDIGRYKVDAVADRIRRDHPDATVTPLRYDVIRDADLVRTLLDQVDVVVCSADGVAARQTTSHLCSMAGTAAIYACVLEDGALGELVRDPARSDVGCLRCLRRSLDASGSMDPEPGLDLEYGTGTTHRPMTAIAGDLGLMGALAAKGAVATLLERAGYRDQRWSGNHMVIGLRPDRSWAAPFDQVRVLDVSASSMPTPDAECPLCCGDRSYE